MQPGQQVEVMGYIRFKSTNDSNLMNLYIGDALDSKLGMSFSIRSISFLITNVHLSMLDIILPVGGEMEIKVTGDDGVFGAFIAMNLALHEEPSEKGLEGFHGGEIKVSSELLEFWVSESSPKEWTVSKAKVEEFKKRDRKPPQSKLIIP